MPPPLRFVTASLRDRFVSLPLRFGAVAFCRRCVSSPLRFVNATARMGRDGYRIS